MNTKAYPTQNTVLRKAANWRNLYFYQKADTLYQITYIFCDRFLPKFGDRTVDQMTQAARSGKQNIVEGSEDGKTSTEMELKLLNVARSSIQELREDYADYLKTRNLPLWNSSNPRYDKMLQFCREHNTYEEYEPLLKQLTDEEMANMALTLCHLTDKMMTSYLQKLETQFVTEGGIKERMHAARTGYRQHQDEYMHAMENEIASLKRTLAAKEQEIAALREQLAKRS